MLSLYGTTLSIRIGACIPVCRAGNPSQKPIASDNGDKIIADILVLIIGGT